MKEKKQKRNNEEPIEIRNKQNLIDVVITRGRFNKFIHQVVENTRQDIIKNMEESEYVSN